MKCPHCGKEIPDLYKICPYCKNAVDTPPVSKEAPAKGCHICGTVSPVNSSFCSKCGANLNQTETRQDSQIPTPPKESPQRPKSGDSASLVGRVVIGLVKIFVAFTILCVISAVVAAFVFGISGDISKSSPTVASPSGVTAAPTTHTPTDLAQFSKVTHLSASTRATHWTSGPTNDGITVFADLRDDNDGTVYWRGDPLSVDIQIYSTKIDSNYQMVNDKIIYQGTGKLTTWEDGNMFMGGGIRIPFSSIRAPAGLQIGHTLVTVHTPDGKTYADTDQFTSLSS